MFSDRRYARMGFGWRSTGRAFAVVVGLTGVSAFFASTATALPAQHLTTRTVATSKTNCTRTSHGSVKSRLQQSPLPTSVTSHLQAEVAHGWQLTAAGRLVLAGGVPTSSTPQSGGGAQVGQVLLAMGPGSKVTPAGTTPPAAAQAPRALQSASAITKTAEYSPWYYPLGCDDELYMEWIADYELGWHTDNSVIEGCEEEEEDSCQYIPNVIDNYCYGQCDYLSYASGPGIVFASITLETDAPGPDALTEIWDSC